MEEPFRIEKDSLGEVRVPATAAWGAQTERARQNFQIGQKKMPHEIIRALLLIKWAAALTNCECGKLSEEKRDLIVKICRGFLQKNYQEPFPLCVWQTGSGTQTNMNVNEVIANCAEVEKYGSIKDTSRFIHPNDDVNQSQSTNDVFPTAIRIATALLIVQKLLPNLHQLQDALTEKATQFEHITKVGRTHLMDATTLTLGQEFSAFASQIQHDCEAIEAALPHVCELPIGGTAVGTGLNTPPHYTERILHHINQLQSDNVFTAAECKFEAIASHDSLVEMSGALKRTAVSLMKIANDFRLLNSGPRCGIGELILPANEPGSTIMPGKVNPTQCEALAMVCCQVIGNDLAITTGGFQGNLQLNVFMPLIANNLIESIHLLSDAVNSFVKHCVVGVKVNEKKIKEYLESSLMEVTALTPDIGYDCAAQIAQYAYQHDLTIAEAVDQLNIKTMSK